MIFPGAITIIKQASPEGLQAFRYGLAVGRSPNFSLVDDGVVPADNFEREDLQRHQELHYLHDC